ncbi:hypothetical protein GCM10025865_33490 (plasmid) [Paraoerskovia sediminicola]|uniref:Toxin-antitoxin system n=1 Tax=Paraoerskovia sediminicola TaxID=1138587 RepID=A0ABM8G7A8_9CELL|nr:hypothetical protein [Paraoerskovia sediminicola]BDZ44050.1 hypothetical protein GCM10025865_33490 [Paraoerskovia sediminicola]
MAGPGRPGRKSKGDRDQFITRTARPVGDVLRERAEAAGLTYSDYIANVLAAHVGLPELAPSADAPGQGQFNMTEEVVYQQSA